MSIVPDQIRFLLVVDTDSIVARYPKASQDPNNPTSVDHQGQYLICHSPWGIFSGQATEEMKISVPLDTNVGFFATSIDNNSDGAVILYDIQHHGNISAGNFAPSLILRAGAVRPDPNSENGVPPIRQPTTFSNFSSQVKRFGPQRVHICFAVYTLDDGGETQNLYGYFRCNPSITVSLIPS